MVIPALIHSSCLTMFQKCIFLLIPPKPYLRITARSSLGPCAQMGQKQGQRHRRHGYNRTERSLPTHSLSL